MKKEQISCIAQNYCFYAGPCRLVEFIVVNTSVILIMKIIIYSYN